MKKTMMFLLVVSVFTGMLDAAPAWWNDMTNQLRSVPGGIARKWHCVKNPDQYNCTPQERTSAKIWITGAATATVLAVLTVVGIKTNVFQLSKVQKEADQTVREEVSSESDMALRDKANLKLFISIIHDSVDEVKQALNEGADANYRSAIGPMLEVAADKRNSGIVRLLLEKGAFPFISTDAQRATSAEIRDMVTRAFKR